MTIIRNGYCGAELSILNVQHPTSKGKMCASGAERFLEESELGFAVVVGDFVFVEGVDLDGHVGGGDVVVDGEDRARGADVVPEAVGDHRAALDAWGEVEAVVVG